MSKKVSSRNCKQFRKLFLHRRSVAFHGMLSFRMPFPTSLQPISRCKAIKTSEERRRRNPFRHFSFAPTVYGFIAFRIRFWFAVGRGEKCGENFFPLNLLATIIEAQGYKSARATPTESMAINQLS